MASDISGQNSSTMVSNFFKANTLTSGIGSSKREIYPAATYGMVYTIAVYSITSSEGKLTLNIVCKPIDVPHMHKA